MVFHLKSKQSFKFQTIYNLNLLHFGEIPKKGNTHRLNHQREPYFVRKPT